MPRVGNCITCGTEISFPARGYRRYCETCKPGRRAKQSLERYHKNPEEAISRGRKYRLSSVFGITPEQYEELLVKQGGCCAVCKRHHSEFARKLAVDHDHKTGEIRGLLCINCNLRIIGRHRDHSLFENAASYLKGPYTDLFVPEKRPKRRRRKKKK